VKNTSAFFYSTLAKAVFAKMLEIFFAQKQWNLPLVNSIVLFTAELLASSFGSLHTSPESISLMIH
jgi:hypothetical protein